MHIKSLGFILSFVFVSAITSLFAQASTEEITITTYYPSPVGSYRDLNVFDSLTLQTTGNDGPQIQWRNSSTRHWNIDQFGNRLRFFTEDNTDLNGIEFISFDNTAVTLGGGSGTTQPYNLIISAPMSANPTDAGDIIFQTSSGTQRARIWSDTGISPELRLSSADNIADITIDQNGRVGVGTTNPRAQLDVDGGIKVGDDSTCNPSKAGTMRYHNSNIEYCNGTSWSAMNIARATVMGYCPITGMGCSSLGLVSPATCTMFHCGCLPGFTRILMNGLGEGYAGNGAYSCIKN